MDRTFCDNSSTIEQHLQTEKSRRWGDVWWLSQWVISETLFHLRLQSLIIVKYYFLFLFLQNNSMHNGMVEDRFNYYLFRKGIWFGVLGTSHEGSHPRVGGAFYLLNKLVFNRSNSENLFLHSDQDFSAHYEIFLCV